MRTYHVRLCHRSRHDGSRDITTLSFPVEDDCAENAFRRCCLAFPVDEWPLLVVVADGHTIIRELETGDDLPGRNAGTAGEA